MLKSEPLYYLLELARSNSFRIASENLHITQPTLSIAIKKLEEDLGIVIFDRTTRSIQLTENGKKVVKIAKQIVEKLDELETLKEAGAPQSYYEMIKLYTFPALSEGMLPSIISKLYLNEHFGKIIIEDLYLCEMLEIIEKDIFSFALVWEINNDVDKMKSKYVEGHTIYNSQGAVMLAQESSLIAENVSKISFKEVRDLPIVSFSRGYGMDAIMLEILREKVGKPKNLIVVPNMNLYDNLLCSGKTIAFGADLTSMKCIENGEKNYKNYRFVTLKENINFELVVYNNVNCPEKLKNSILELLKNIC